MDTAELTELRERLVNLEAALRYGNERSKEISTKLDVVITLQSQIGLLQQSITNQGSEIRDLDIRARALETSINLAHGSAKGARLIIGVVASIFTLIFALLGWAGNKILDDYVQRENQTIATVNALRDTVNQATFDIKMLQSATPAGKP